MEWLWSPDLWESLGAIVVINLVLSGDNAIVIALAARNLSPEHQRRAIVWGTVGAVAARIALALVIVWLLGIPWLRAVGAVLLAWIAYQLLTEHKPTEDGSVKAASTLGGAMRTIIVADATMGLDNVLGVAGAAEGNITLLTVGMLLSIPIVVWGSTFILRLLERFPWVLYAGSAVLAWTAAQMFVEEPHVAEKLEGQNAVILAIKILTIAAVLGAAWLANRAARAKPRAPA